MHHLLYRRSDPEDLLSGASPDYWANHWNKFDFRRRYPLHPDHCRLRFSVRFTSSHLPSSRFCDWVAFLRFMRLMRFVPNADHIWRGVGRALSASISIFLVLLTLNLILAVGATMLFGDLPDPASEILWRSGSVDLHDVQSVYRRGLVRSA